MDAFVDFVGRHAEAGDTEIIIHWPIPDAPEFTYDRAAFERSATEAPQQPTY